MVHECRMGLCKGAFSNKWKMFRELTDTGFRSLGFIRATHVVNVESSLNCVSGCSAGDPLNTSPLPLKGRVASNLYRFH